MIYPIVRKDGTVKQYDFISEFKEGFAAVRLDNKWGFIDEEGNEICPIEYTVEYFNKAYQVRHFSEGYAVVGMLNGTNVKVGVDIYPTIRFGYINTKGELVCSCKFKQACDFDNGHAFVLDENNKCWMIDKNFQTLTKREYDRIYDFNYGYAVVEFGGKFGFINEYGVEICSPKYSYMDRFIEHKVGVFAQVKLPDKQDNVLYFVNTKDELYFLDWASGKLTKVDK